MVRETQMSRLVVAEKIVAAKISQRVK